MTNALQTIPVNKIDGTPATLAEHAGKVLLVVNVASKCGLTPQYAKLEELHERYASRGFTVVGIPCNQFGGQEPGTAEEIARFCELDYGVSFPLFAKVEVNGENAHPLFVHLKTAAPGVLGSTAIKWNFTKFLVARDGRVVRRYAPNDAPEKLIDDIETLLEERYTVEP